MNLLEKLLNIANPPRGSRKAAPRTTNVAKEEGFFVVDGQKIPMLIKRSARRKSTTQLQMKQTGIIISAPVRATNKAINEFMREKESRILKKRELMSKRRDTSTSFKEGDHVPFLGESFTMDIIPSKKKRTTLRFLDTHFECNVFQGLTKAEKQKSITSALKKRYKSMATQYITERVLEISEEFGLEPRNITVKNYKAKYGQCAGRDVFFSYKIVQFPPEIIKHVIMHELAHLKHKHHGPRFREALTKMDPDTKKHNARLRDHGVMLE